jgi:hypothetical protein
MAATSGCQKPGQKKTSLPAAKALSVIIMTAVGIIRAGGNLILSKMESPANPGLYFLCELAETLYTNF